MEVTGFGSTFSRLSNGPGFLICGDCGAPMFAMSRKDLVTAYTCGTYHRRGRADLQKRIAGLQKQLELLSGRRNTILRANRAAKTAMEVFRDILEKEKLERNDLELMIRNIRVYENRLEIQLQPDIDTLIARPFGRKPQILTPASKIAH